MIRWFKTNWWILILLFYVFSFIYRSDQSFEQDLGRHLKLGEIIWQTHQIPKVNLFSYTYPEFPFVNHHWGFQVIVYLINRLIGPIGLMLMKIGLILGAVFLVLKLLPTKSYLLTTTLGFLFLHVLRERIELRPELFSFFFTALTIYILERTKGRWLWFLIFIQLLWTNIHIYFPIGLMIQGIFFIDLFFKKDLNRTKTHFLVLVSSGLISLINPNFITGALYPFKVFGNYGYTIVENQTIFFLEALGFSDPNFIFVKGCWIIASLALLSLTISRKSSVKELGLLGLGVAFSLQNVRSIPYLFFITLPSITVILSRLHIGGVTWKSIRGAGLGLVILVLIIESYLYLSGDYYKKSDQRFLVGLSLEERGEGAMNFVNNNHLAGPIFNNFDIGSFIIYKSYPDLRVFVDGRPEAYPADFFQSTYIPIQYDYNKFKELDKQTNFQTIIYSHTDQTPWGKSFISSINKDSNWKLVFVDDLIMVLSKNQTPMDISEINPDKYNFKSHIQYVYLGLFLANIGQDQKALEFFKSAYKLNPDSPIVNKILFNRKVESPWW